MLSSTRRGKKKNKLLQRGAVTSGHKELQETTGLCGGSVIQVAMAALGTQLSSLSLSPVQLTSSGTARTETTGPWRVNLIECAKRPQKKCTAHHVKSRPKKHNPYDKNRHGPTVYPRLPKPPPIWGFDNGEALPVSEDED